MMRPDIERLRELILLQFKNNNLKPKTQAAAKAEYFIIVGYLAMQAELGEKLDPYLSMLAMSGRRLTEERTVQ